MGIEEHVAVLVLDTAIAGVTEEFGDFGDNTIALLRQSPLPIKKYQIAYDLTSSDADALQKNAESVLAQVAELIGFKKIKALVLTGSRSDSFDQSVAWINLLDEFIQHTLFTRPNFPVVGICFGHQILAKNLGCKVGRNAAQGWELGTTTIELNSSIFDIAKSPFRRALTNDDGEILTHLNLVEFHRDIVFGLPVTSSSLLSYLADTSFQNIGRTAKCSIQGLISEEGPIKILTFQGHPEFTTEEALRILEIDVEKGIIDRAAFEKLTYNTKNLINQGSVVGKIIVDFINLFQ